jgi:hypothetical protein
VSGPLVAQKSVTKGTPARKVIYWHRELPPFNAEAIGEHTIEASSRRVPGTFAHRDELWNQCYEDVMDRVRKRLQQEVTRLEGNYAHILSESIDSKYDAVAGEAWLHGCFTYMLYR